MMSTIRPQGSTPRETVKSLMGDAPHPTGDPIGPEPSAVPDFVDVSRHQGDIDWQAYHASGRTMGVCKVTEGRDWVDARGEDNRVGMRAEDLYCGVYHFAGGSGSGRINPPEVEAQHFLDTVGPLAAKEFPVLDFELPYGLSPSQQVDWIGRWCTKVESATGKQPWLYTNSKMLRKMDASSLTRFPLWIANYNSSNPAEPPSSGSWPQLTAWQFTDNATTPGIEGPTDRSYLYGDMSKLVPATSPPTPPQEPPTGPAEPAPSDPASPDPTTP